MSTKAYFPRTDIGPGKVGFSKTRSIIEAPFYGNNVVKINSLREAYDLAKNSPGTVVTDMPVYRGEEFGLEPDAKVLLFNDGSITGRYAPARRITGKPGVDTAALDKIVMDAVYDTRWKTMYHAEVFIGLDTEFMVKAHLLIPEGEENLLDRRPRPGRRVRSQVPVLLQHGDQLRRHPGYALLRRAQKGHPDPGLGHCQPQRLRLLPRRPEGIHPGRRQQVRGSCVRPLRLRQVHPHPCLHDDAFIINTDTCASVALEPTYFDKTADYPVDSEDNKYLLTAQNCSATLDEDGKIVLVTEDVRNGNGRAIKSKLWSPNRVDKIDSPVNAIFWIMKDPTIPPIVRLKGSALASVMGATLATKRSSAERLKAGVDPNALVVEPYANPFRTYPLHHDYEKFKKLVEEKNVSCYIINTGDFMGKKVQKEDTLGILEAVVEGKASFKPWGPFTDIEILEWDGFVPDLANHEYVAQLKARMQDRLTYVTKLDTEEGGFNKLPADAAAAIQKVVDQANTL